MRSEYGKIKIKIAPNTDTFHTELVIIFCLSSSWEVADTFSVLSLQKKEAFG